MQSLFSQSNGHASTDLVASDANSPAYAHSAESKTSSLRLATPPHSNTNCKKEATHKGWLEE